MRTSVARITGKCRTPLKSVPEGRTGEIYQEFLQASGSAINAPAINTGQYHFFRSVLERLRDSYNCDIRRVGRGKYALVGMWTDKGYVDFVAKNWRGQRA